MRAGSKLLWYARRLERMSGREVVHRVAEHAKKMTDARRGFGWDGFSSFEGPLTGMPGLVPAPNAAAHPDVESIEAGTFRLLGQQWQGSTGAGPWYAQAGAWHLDPVSGNLWPGAGTFAFQVPYRHQRRFGDVKFVWELNRLQLLQVLAACGASRSAADILESWMEANPPFEGINWTAGIEAASRVVSVLVLLSLAPPEVRRHIDLPARRFLAAHVYWIARYPSLHSSANNHRVAELASLLLAAICAPGLPASSLYLARSLVEIEQLASNLFHPDGVGAEQSPTYAAYALEWFAIAGLAAASAGRPFSEIMRSRLHAAALHLRLIMDDGGRVPRVGDDDEGRVLVSHLHREDRYVASVLALVARWLGSPALLPPSSDRHLRDQFAPPTQPLPAQGAGMPVPAVEIGNHHVSPALKIFPHGGYTVARSSTSRGTLLTVFDHGPLGFGAIAAHGHADALAIWLHWGDEPILVDAGTYLYHASRRDRDLFRGTPVHNTLALDEADQSLIVGPFNWRRHAHTRVVACNSGSISAEHDGYLRRFGLIHRRDLSFERNTLVIDDHLIGRPSKARVRWSMGFLLGSQVETRLDGPSANIKTRCGRKLSLHLDSPDLGWTRIPGEHSPAFNCRGVLDHLRTSGNIFARQPPRLPHIRTIIRAHCPMEEPPAPAKRPSAATLPSAVPTGSPRSCADAAHR
jgi:heparinase II/III-like protein